MGCATLAKVAHSIIMCSNTFGQVVHIYIYIRVLQKIPKFKSYNAHSSNGLP